MSLTFNIDNLDINKYNEELVNLIKKINYEENNNETVVRNEFEFLIKMFLINTGLNADDNALKKLFNPERPVDGKDGKKLFVDSDYKNIIIEYKKYKRLDKQNEFEKAEKQLKDYMNVEDFNKYNTLTGILFDGKSIHIYEKNNGLIEKDTKNSGLISINNIDVFIKTIVNYDKKDISSYNIKEDFSILNPENSTHKLFEEIYKMKSNSKNQRTKLLFNEWEKLFKLSESESENDKDFGEVKLRRDSLSKLIKSEVNSSDDEYAILYSLHTTYSIIIKLFALKSSRELKINGIKTNFTELYRQENKNIKGFLTELENGNIFKSFGVLNMIEGDFFSWYIKENLTDDFYNTLKDLFLMLSKYENTSFKVINKTQDFFRELYESSIPSEIRHSFGEYYTPNWLADAVVSDYLERNNKDIYKSLDPTCGSGTFVIVNINKMINVMDKSTPNKKIVKTIIENCKGIDLNPLAVLGAKINYFMNISNLYDGSYNIEIPIYLGDSSYMPSIVDIGGIKCIEYDFFTNVEDDSDFIHFCLPLEFVKNEEFICQMDSLESYIVEKSYEKSLNYLKKCIGEENLNEVVFDEAEKLIKKLIDLENKNLNSIWLRIFANYLKTATLSNFDLISGNPPWVDWKNLPEKYRDKLKISNKDTGIFSNDKNTGGISLNIASLIVMKVAEKYLSPEGEISFLMPKSMLFNKSFEGFRKFTINKQKYYFQKIIDWSFSGNPFNPVKIGFCSYIISKKEQDYTNGIDFETYFINKKEKLSINHTLFIKEKEKFTYKNNKALILSEKSNNPFILVSDDIDSSKLKNVVGNNEYVFRSGLGLKATVHKLIFKENHPTDDKLAIFNKFDVGIKFKKVSDEEVVLEKKYVKPLIETTHLGTYNIEWDNLYTVFPYEEGSKKPIPFEELETLAPYMARYLKNNKKELMNQSEYNKRIQQNDEFYGIIRVGSYTWRENFVCIRDNSKLISSISSKVKNHWGENVMPLFDGHVNYISEYNNTPITEDEAYFISGILNNKLVRFYVENSSDKQSISSKFDVFIPKYEASNTNHKHLVNLSKKIHSKINDRLNYISLIKSKISNITELNDINLIKVEDEDELKLVEKVIDINLELIKLNSDLENTYISLINHK